MSARSPLVVFGAGITILGYAVIYNGLSNLLWANGTGSASFPWGPQGIIPSLVPGAVLGGPGSSTGGSTSGGGGGGAAGGGQGGGGGGTNPSPGSGGPNQRPGHKPRRRKKKAA